MSYKIVRVTDLYKEHLEQYYSRFYNLQEKNFQYQYDHLIENSQDIASSVCRNFRNIGVDALVIFTNAARLQKQWMLENKCAKSGGELVVEQLKRFRPDIVWLDDITLIDRKWISYLRDTIPSIKIVTGHLCAPYNSSNLENLRALDFLFTCTPCFKEEFSKNGIETYLIYHSFEETILERIDKDNFFPNNKFLFAGSLYTGGGFHNTRIEYLEEILRSGLPLSIYGNVDSRSKIRLKTLIFKSLNFLRNAGLKNWIKHIPVLKDYQSYGDSQVKFYSSELRARMLPPVHGLEQLKLLSRAEICFNIHIGIAGDCAGNLRLFEATGVGTCLVTDWKKNIQDLFEPEKEVVTYRTKEECVEKIKWLIEHPSERAGIAKAGQMRTLKDHTVLNRVHLMHEIFVGKLKQQ